MKKFLKIIFLCLLITCLIYANAGDMIEIGDVLIVNVFDSENNDLITGSFYQSNIIQSGRDPHEMQVANSGKIFINLIGEIEVANKTTEQVKKEILEKFNKYQKNIQVSVLLKTIKTNKIYIFGEVLNPGMYEIIASDFLGNRLFRLIQMAGGFSVNADQENIAVVRDSKTITANLYDLINNNNVDQNLKLKNGDTVIVKAAFAKVYVLGQVNSPRGIPFVQGANFIDYISEAGGLNDRANFNHIAIAKRQGDKLVVHKVNFNPTRTGLIGQEAEIEPGDIIYVSKNFFADLRDIAVMLGIARDSVYIYDTVSK